MAKSPNPENFAVWIAEGQQAVIGLCEIARTRVRVVIARVKEGRLRITAIECPEVN